MAKARVEFQTFLDGLCSIYRLDKNRRPALLLACTASGQWLTTANPRDSYDPQYSLYALWDPADFLADGQPAAWVTMYATE